MSPIILPREGILAFMHDESRSELAAYGSTLTATAGQVLIEEGEPQNCLYIVITGLYHVSTRIRDREVHLDSVGEGDCFGEVAIFQPGPASATVTCASPGEVWHLGSESLQHFIGEGGPSCCALLLGINTILSRRLKQANGVITANEIVPSFLSVRTRKLPDMADLRARRGTPREEAAEEE
jgi:CRP/FNR family cyclic AMP-dependent transcriptional regulator